MEQKTKPEATKAPAKPIVQKVKITEPVLNVRKEPRRKADILEVLLGSKKAYPIIEEIKDSEGNEWVMIQVESGIGWVMKEFTKKA